MHVIVLDGLCEPDGAGRVRFQDALGLPGSVRGDAAELALEKAFRAAYIGRGPWPTRSLK